MSSDSIVPASSEAILSEMLDSLDRDILPEEARELAICVGSDKERQLAADISAFLHLVFYAEHEQHGLEALLGLKEIPPVFAYRVFGLLPDPVYEDRDEKIQMTSKHFYIGTHYWLISRLDNKSPVVSDLLTELFSEGYEVYARMSELRHDMIRRMLELGAFPKDQLSPVSAWLLAEASEAYQRCQAPDGISHRASYDAEKDYQAEVDELAEEGSTDSAHLIELRGMNQIFWFGSIADNRAASIAVTDAAFEKLYYKPYMKARKQWKRHCSRSKSMRAAANPDGQRNRNNRL